MSIASLYVGSDNRVRWDRLRDNRTDEYINDATVTVTVKTEAGVAIAGLTDVAMPYVAASNGRYQGLLLYAFTVLLIRGQRYFVEVTADRGTYRDFRRFQAIARYRGAT